MLLIRIVSGLNHFQLPLFMLSKVNVTFLLIRIFSSLFHFQLRLFMLSKVNVTFFYSF